MQAAQSLGVDPYAKDVFQIIAWFAAILGAFIAVWKALVEVRENRQQRIKDQAQRIREMRWGQAKISKELLDDMFDDPYAKAAMTMLDWSGREFEIKKNVVEKLYESDTQHGLRTTNLEAPSDKDIYIRDCFDRFFYHVDRIEQSIRIDLINFEDAKFPLDYSAASLYPYVLINFSYTSLCSRICSA